MVSKASEDFPEPDKPVKTINRSRGSSRSMFFRLCVRARRMTIEEDMGRQSFRWRGTLGLDGTEHYKVGCRWEQKRGTRALAGAFGPALVEKVGRSGAYGPALRGSPGYNRVLSRKGSFHGARR